MSQRRAEWPPTLVITGASGFLGRQVVEALRDQYQIIAIDWRPPQPEYEPHPHVRWVQADLGDRTEMLKLGRDARGPPPALVIHLAAHYEFEQTDEKPYFRTNVDGLRNMLDCAVAADIKGFIFASSLAACRFPSPGEALTESSHPDASHVYARTKSLGEEMLRSYQDRLKSVIVRFAAMYSDYCEYPPLFKFLDTWLSTGWNRRMLGGRGRSAIPFLHVRDASRFLRTVVGHFGSLEDREVLIASPDGCTSHFELFRGATEAYFGASVPPIFVPRWLIRPGIHARMLIGRISGKMPFERPWMAEYVDREMRVDATRTQNRLGWATKPRLAILERLPLLIENLRAYPGEWLRKNEGALDKSTLRPNLIVHGLIQRHRDEIGRRISERLTARNVNLVNYQKLGAGEHTWNHRVALNHLMQAVRTRTRKLFVDYCADLAARRFEQGFTGSELRFALRCVQEVVLDVLREEPIAEALESSIHQDIEVTMRFALDEVEEVFDELETKQVLARLSKLQQQERAREHEGIGNPR